MSEPVRVLHVDDEPEIADLTAEFLKREFDQCTVDTAMRASGALDQLTNEIDCIVSDYDMPGQNGIELLKTVREEYPDLPFILYTGKGSEEVASDAISAGVTDYLQKGSGTDTYKVLANRIQNAVDRVRAQRERQRHLDAIETAQEGISILDETGHFIYVNDAYADLYGYDPKKIRGEHWEVIYRDEDVPHIYDEVLPTVEEDGHWHGTTTGLRADGTTFVEDHVLATADHGELICTVRDITHETTLEETYELVARASTDAFWVWDPDTDAIRRSEEYLTQFGYESSDVEGETDWWRERIHPDDRDRVLGALETAVTSPKATYDESYRFRRKDGSYGYVRSRGYVVYGEGGDPERMVGAHIDITDRKEYEQAIETLHKTVQDLSQAQTPQNVADLAVDAVAETFGMPVTAVHLYDDTEDALHPTAWTGAATEVIGEIPSFRPDEGLAWTVFETGEENYFTDVSTVEGRLNPDTGIRSELILPLGDHGILTIGSTDRDAFVDLERSLARTLTTHVTTALDRIDQEQKLRTRATAMETSIDGMSILDTTGEYRFVNQAHAEIFGYDDPDAFLGETWHMCYAEDEFARFENNVLPTLYEDGAWRGETIGQRRDGTTFPQELSLTMTEANGIVCVVRDVTERVETRRELERQNERLEQFASVVSHDLRNPLTVAKGRLTLAREESESTHLDTAAAAIERSEALIDDLLTLAQKGDRVDTFEPIALDDVVEACWRYVETDEATLVIETAQTIRADPSRLRQLLENLIRNAIDHGGTDVTLTVGALADGFYVADDGPGIAASERERIFDAGYTTTQSGTGFGLNIVAEIADAHGWTIDVTESIDGGARFETTGVEVIE